MGISSMVPSTLDTVAVPLLLICFQPLGKVSFQYIPQFQISSLVTNFSVSSAEWRLSLFDQAFWVFPHVLTLTILIAYSDSLF